METLELKYLAPYLPYNLKAICTTNQICTIGDGYNHIYKGDIMQIGVDDYRLFQNETEYFKPILRILSDLAKEIEKDGKKFVPLIELAKLASPKNTKIKLMNDHVSLGHDYTFHYDNKNLSFNCLRGFDGKKADANCFVFNQLLLFQKLFEWHFDVFGLIEKGLAVDINELRNK
ncbi:MAG: hypothetical protein WC026_13235 [Hyphomicrobium sp.]|uniref:hypothetical protein n=1 Tax=Hyphomicrobium sp. TaxID=82 RepID=UPI003569FA9C